MRDIFNTSTDVTKQIVLRVVSFSRYNPMTRDLLSLSSKSI